MATGTGMISAQTRGVNPPLLIRSNLEKVAAIAGAVASFALAIFALIGSEYLVAALSAAAGLSILYAFMKRRRNSSRSNNDDCTYCHPTSRDDYGN